eukprot:s636_g33.t1
MKKIENAFEHITFTKRTLRELRILRHLRHENLIDVRVKQHIQPNPAMLHALLEGEEHVRRKPSPRLSRTFRSVSVDDDRLPQREEGSSMQEIPALSVAMLMSAINAVSYGIWAALGTLLFATPFTATAPNGTVIWIMSTIGAQIGMVLVSDVQNGISCPMLEMIPMMHSTFLNIAAKMPEADAEQLQATCLASCFVCTLTIGVGLLIGTRLGLASYLRAVPLIVLKGALFGVALFLMSSCLTVATGDSTGSLSATWQLWAPAVLLGLTLFAVDEAVHSPVVISLSLLLVGLIPTCLDLFKIIPLSELQEKGWYLQVADAYRSALFRIDWMVILEIMPAMVGIAASASLLMRLGSRLGVDLVNFSNLCKRICCVSLMDLKAVELLTEREFSLDKELRSIGVSNLISALCGGGFPCYILCSLNVTCHRLGGRSKVGLIMSSTCCLFVVFNVVPHLPRALPGGLFMWLSLVFAKETIVDICSKYTHISDVFTVAVMALVVKFYSFNDGLLLGALLAMTFFTLRYSGTQAGVKTAGDARFYRSICTRDGFEHEALEKLGHLIAVVHVDGFLMFGSTPAFTDAVAWTWISGPEWILLNFQAVQSLDYSAALELALLGRKAKECGRRLVLTELNRCVQDVLRTTRVEMQQLPRPTPGRTVSCGGLFYQAQYQRALQRCEDGVLSRIGLRMPSKSQATSLGSEEAFVRDVLKRYFGDFLPEDTSLETTLSIFSKRTVEAGAVLWRAGDQCSYCVCVLEGTLHGMQPSRKAGSPDRLACIAGPGDFIGFLAMLNHFPYEQTVLVPEELEDEDEGACRLLVLEKMLCSIGAANAEQILSAAERRSALRPSLAAWLPTTDQLRVSGAVAAGELTPVSENGKDAVDLARQDLEGQECAQRNIFLSGSKHDFEDIYVISELMETDLASILKSQQSLTDDHCQFFLYQILRGMKYVHSAQVIHRDLKPRNLLVNGNCDLKICDFGLARVSFSKEFQTCPMTEYVCTRWYRAPEVLCSWVDYTTAIDIWSIGCIFAEMLERKPLFPGHNTQHQLQSIINFVGKPVPEELNKIKNEKCRRFIESLPAAPGLNLEDAFPEAAPSALEFLSATLRFDPEQRVPVTEALTLSYVSQLYCPEDEPVRGPLDTSDFEFERRKINIRALREELWLEVLTHPANKVSDGSCNITQISGRFTCSNRHSPPNGTTCHPIVYCDLVSLSTPRMRRKTRINKVQSQRGATSYRGLSRAPNFLSHESHEIHLE